MKEERTREEHLSSDYIKFAFRQILSEFLDMKNFLKASLDPENDPFFIFRTCELLKKRIFSLIFLRSLVKVP